MPPSNKSNWLEPLTTYAAHSGWIKSVIHALVGNAARRLNLHLYIIRKKTMLPDPDFPALDVDVELRRAGREELLRASTNPALGLECDFINLACDKGDHAYGAFVGSNLVAYIWRARHTGPDRGSIWIAVDPPYCYSYNLLVLPEYRGHRIATALRLYADQEMYRDGFRSWIGFVSVGNFQNLASGKHNGLTNVGFAAYADWFGHLLSFRTRRVKEIGFRFFRADSDQPSPSS